MTEEVRKQIEPGQCFMAQAGESFAGHPSSSKPERQFAMAALEPPRKKAAPKAYTPVFEPVNALRTRMTAEFAVTLITQGGCMHVPCTSDTQLSHVFYHAEQLLACTGQSGHPVMHWKGEKICNYGPMQSKRTLQQVGMSTPQPSKWTGQNPRILGEWCQSD